VEEWAEDLPVDNSHGGRMHDSRVATVALPNNNMVGKINKTTGQPTGLLEPGPGNNDEDAPYTNRTSGVLPVSFGRPINLQQLHLQDNEQLALEKTAEVEAQAAPGNEGAMTAAVAQLQEEHGGGGRSNGTVPGGPGEGARRRGCRGRGEAPAPRDGAHWAGGGDP
jgi:hypothetical protein